MYEVGDYIVHPGQGVCKVEGIKDGPHAVYELLPIGERHPMRISYPVSSEDKLRPILSASEAKEIIDQYPSMDVEEFSERSNALQEEHFKNEIKRGTCRDSVRIVKTFRQRIAQTRAQNKKPPVVYERILKQASKRSLDELSVALDMTPDDVLGLFEDTTANEHDN
ncbi:MAG: CarD family transcriptional regulator [Atopobiaceae bacterium]